MKKNIHPILKQKCYDLLHALKSECSHEVSFIVDDRGSGDAHISDFPSRVKHIGNIRHLMVQEHLSNKHSYVFWMDSDIIYTSPNLLNQLVELCGNKNIAAPSVTIKALGDNRWYDIGGFIHDEIWASLFPPYFNGLPSHGIVEVNGSVGCVYMVPSHYYKNNTIETFVPSNPQHTEHYPICEICRNNGGKLIVNLDLNADHCNLADYGENWH